MANRFVQFKPLDYKPSTYPLELLNETVKERRKLLDASEEAFDALNQFRSMGIAGTAYEKEAAAINKEWQNRKSEVKDFIAKNPGDVYAQIRKIKELQRGITNDLLTGKAGAVKRAYDDYVTSYQELLKHADKKDSYTANRLSDAVYMFKKGLQDLGGFDPEAGRYNKESSLAAPPPEYDVYSRLTEVLKNTPELKKYSLASGKDGYTLVDRTTGIEYKEGKTLVQNMLGALQGDAHYISDLGFRSRLEAAKGDITDPDDMKEITQRLFQNDYGQIAGYAYVNDIKPDIHRMKDPALDLRMHREKLGAMQQLYDASRSYNTPPPREVGIGATLDQVDYNNLDYEKILKNITPSNEGFSSTIGDTFNNIIMRGIGGYGFGDKPKKLQVINLKKEASKIADAISENEPSFDKNKFMLYVNELIDQGITRQTIRGLVNGYQTYYNNHSNRDQLVGIPVSMGDQKAITDHILQSEQYPVTIIGKDGKIEKYGTEYTVADLKNDEKINETTRKDVTKFVVTDLVGPSIQNKDYAFSIKLGDGRIALVSTLDGLNIGNNFKNTMNDYNEALLNAKKFQHSNSGIRIGSNRVISFTGVGGDDPISNHMVRGISNRLPGFIDIPRDVERIESWDLAPSDTRLNPADNRTQELLYNKVFLTYIDNKGRRKRVTVYNGQPMSLNGADAEMGTEYTKGSYERYFSKNKTLTYKGNVSDYQVIDALTQ